MADKTIKTFSFLIGGETIQVPELNLYASRVALRTLPAAFASDDPDMVVGGMLDVLAALLEDAPDERFRLTADQLQRRIRGREETVGLNTSMMDLLKSSGFFQAGETAPSPAAALATGPSTPTLQSTESSSQSDASSDAQTSDGSSAPGPSDVTAPS